MKESVTVKKSREFALRIVKLYQYLCQEKHECILSKQLLRSGTSIGANIREARRGQSKADFYAKLNISLKEADETEYWLDLLHDSGYLDDHQYNNIFTDADELIKLLVATTKTQNK